MSGDVAGLPLARVRWRPSYRVVAARYGPLEAIEVADDAQEARVALRLLATTGEQARRAARRFDALGHADRPVGPGAGDAIAPFLYGGESRFATSDEGAYYTAVDIETALAEIEFHRVRELRASGARRASIELRELHSDIDTDLVDARGIDERHPELVVDTPGGSATTRAAAGAWRAAGREGVVYDSVRRSGGICAALFRPVRVGVPVRDAARWRLSWTDRDGFVERARVVSGAK